MHAAQAKLTSAAEILGFRESYRREMNCQIVHDSIHRRTGWTLTYCLEWQGVPSGFGSVAIGGPWKDNPTLFEFYVVPEQRVRVFDLFEALLVTSNSRFLEIQSNEPLLDVMLHAYAHEIVSQKIVFQDGATTTIESGGAFLRQVTSSEETRNHIEHRQGGPEWLLELNGNVVGKGGILFHYNVPYGDIYMEIDESFRRKGFGSYLVQELKRVAYEIGAVPCARCDTKNVASRRTLQRAGFVPFAHMLKASLACNE